MEVPVSHKQFASQGPLCSSHLSGQTIMKGSALEGHYTQNLESIIAALPRCLQSYGERSGRFRTDQPCVKRLSQRYSFKRLTCLRADSDPWFKVMREADTK